MECRGLPPAVFWPVGAEGSQPPGDLRGLANPGSHHQPIILRRPYLGSCLIRRGCVSMATSSNCRLIYRQQSYLKQPPEPSMGSKPDRAQQCQAEAGHK